MENKNNDSLDIKVFEKYKHIRDFESEFNKMQDGIRKLTSIWLLASLGGIAYCYNIDANTYYFPVGKGMLSAIVSFLGSLGIFILWIMDQKVYQKLLRAAFIEGCYLESKYKELPQVRRMMMYILKNKGMSWWLASFYTIPQTSFTLIIFCIAFFDSSSNQSEFICILILGGISFIVDLLTIINKTRHSNLAKGREDSYIDKWFKIENGE